MARGAGYTLALTSTEAVFLLRQSTPVSTNQDAAEHMLQVSNSISEPDQHSKIGRTQSRTLRMTLVGANRSAIGTSSDELDGKVNYFLGNDAEQWRRNVPTFSCVSYKDVYPGIDVVYYGNQRRLEYDFVVAPGRDPEAIALEFSGADSVEVEAATGDLLLHLGEHTIRQHAPVTYQQTTGGRREIESRYVLRKDRRVGFAVGDYATSAPLIIDPVLVYSTFLGGNAVDVGGGIAVDSAGNAYVTGSTSSTDFPTNGPLQGARAGSVDVFVTKLNPAGTGIVYSTYLGGRFSDSGAGIAVDSAGNAYVTGETLSPDFPTANAFQATLGGDYDAFVIKLSPAGSALVYSTYLGGTREDSGDGVVLGPDGHAFVTGSTSSANFPTANPIQSSIGQFSDETDAFVTKLNSAGTGLVYSTYLGGIDYDSASDIAVDSAGNAYVTGKTISENFPTINAIKATHSEGAADGFVTKINAAGSALVYSTYLGSDRTLDIGNAIAVDSAGNAYVTGFTGSTNFPTVNPIQATFGGGDYDAFVSKLNAAGSAFVYSTYLGGDNPNINSGLGTDSGSDIAVDRAGNAYVTGTTNSTTFPTADAIQGTFAGRDDAFVTKINAAGSALVYSTYLGGDASDAGTGIGVDSGGNVYVTGTTASTLSFPRVNAIQNTYGGGRTDAFVTKIDAPPTGGATQLLNISTRLRVGTGENALIGGFIITGSEPKKVIIRGLGSSLANEGVAGVLENPTLELVSGAGEAIAFNNNWKDSQQAEIEASTVPPRNDLESAIVRTLAPGNYTAVVRGDGGGTGIGLVEVYDLASATQSKLANISSRGFVETGENVMIGGFIIGGGSGGGSRVLIRAIGPSLNQAGVAGALQDTTLDLVNGNGMVVRSNNNWKDSQRSEIEATGVPPSDHRESALIETTSPGNYTAVVRGAVEQPVWASWKCINFNDAGSGRSSSGIALSDA